MKWRRISEGEVLLAVKDPDKTVNQLIKEKIAQLGENVTVARFVRFQLGQE